MFSLEQIINKKVSEKDLIEIFLEAVPEITDLSILEAGFYETFGKNAVSRYGDRFSDTKGKTYRTLRFTLNGNKGNKFRTSNTNDTVDNFSLVDMLEALEYSTLKSSKFEKKLEDLYEITVIQRKIR